MLKKRRLWDFVFYLLFGCIVTSSVKMVGILLVFSYLVIPILSVAIFTKRIKKQITLGWIIGILCSVVGLGVSILLDVPPSFCIILVLCGAWIVSTLLAYKRSSLNG